MENKQIKEEKMVSIKKIGVIQNGKSQPLRLSNNLIILSANNSGFRNIKPNAKIVAKVVYPQKGTTYKAISVVPIPVPLAKKLETPMPISQSSTKTLAPSVRVPSFSKPKKTNKISPNTSIGSKQKRIFSKELRCMLYGFGDEHSYVETVDMVEDLVLKFIGDISLRALKVGAQDRISIEDLMFVLRKDQKKYSRLKELLDINNELREARKAFEEGEFVEE